MPAFIRQGGGYVCGCGGRAAIGVRRGNGIFGDGEVMNPSSALVLKKCKLVSTQTFRTISLRRTRTMLPALGLH